MALVTSYKAGTVTVAANGTTVTGTGTNWLAAGIRDGDVLAARGLTVSIAAVTSATSLTLATTWPGAALTNSEYEVRYTPDASRVLASSREAIASMESLRGDVFVSANVYASPAAGLADTNVGQQFQTISVNGQNVVRYRHDAGGIATEVARYPTAAGVTDAVAQAQSAAVNAADAIRAQVAVDADRAEGAAALLDGAIVAYTQANVTAARAAEKTGLFSTGVFDTLPRPYGLWGHMRLRSDYAGAILRLRNSQTGAQSDIFADADGRVKFGGMYWQDQLAGGSYQILRYYDQSGQGHDLVTRAGLQPALMTQGDKGDAYGRSQSLDFGFLIQGGESLSTKLRGVTFALASDVGGAQPGGPQYAFFMRPASGSSPRAALMREVNGSFTVRVDPHGTPTLTDLNTGVSPTGWSSVVAVADFAGGRMTAIQDGVKVSGIFAAGEVSETPAGAPGVLFNAVSSAFFTRPYAAMALYDSPLPDAQMRAVEKAIAATAPKINRGPILCRIAYVTDTHFADKSTSGTRYYRDASAKIADVASWISSQGRAIDLFVHGGDVIDGQSIAGQDWIDLATAKASLDAISAPKRIYLIGNHDISASTNRQVTKRGFLDALGQNAQSPYGVTFVRGVRVIWLDSNYSAESDSAGYDQNTGWSYEDTYLNPAQLRWLEDEIGRSSLPTVVFCHTPIDVARPSYALDNGDKVLALIRESGANVLGIVTGHAHDNMRMILNGVPSYRMAAAVEGAHPANAAAIIDVYEDRIEVAGYGSQISRNRE